MHYAENECAMPIRLHCNELRALCRTTNALCRTAEISALLLKCVLIVYIWPEKGVCFTENGGVRRRERLVRLYLQCQRARAIERQADGVEWKAGLCSTHESCCR